MPHPSTLLDRFSTLPESLSQSCRNALEAILEHSDGNLPAWPEQALELVFKGFRQSTFIREICQRHPQWLFDWVKPDSPLYCSRSEEAMRKALQERLAATSNEAELMKALRQFRNAEQARLVWRDITGLATLEGTVAEVSALADVCISLSLENLYRQLVQKHGTPRDLKTGQAQELLVLGMGKLGARELNISSDIDLIFAYPASGETDHPEKPIDNQQFFNKLGQRLIHVLDQVTEDGLVFRVDMRLRPYGSAGALALNYSAFEDYYQNQGREWERFAMVKARPITGSEKHRQILSEIIQPFVYRKYTDFSSIQALRDMKRLITSEVHRKGGENNIKLGSGGIREVEFIVQACQLIHGGRDQELQQTGLLPILQVLKDKEYLPAAWVDQLLEANAFLRNLEHAIQGLKDEQTQLIPDDALARQQVAWSMGFEDWEALDKVLCDYRTKVHLLFASFLEESREEQASLSEGKGPWLHLWQVNAGKDEWLKYLEQAGFEHPDACWEALDELRHSRLFKAMSRDAAKRLELFIPLLLSAAEQMEKPALVFERVMALVRSVLGRTIYLVLLYENPDALQLLCTLCQDSPWVAEHLAKSPVILDELLDAHSLYQPPEKTTLQDELRQVLLRIPEEDLETQMDALRHFKQSHMLRVAAAELSGKLPLMKVSDYLTWLAETLVQRCVTLAWKNMTAKYGLPGGISEGQREIGFAVIGYGKLGGIELNYHSDLDMVFLYDCDENGMTSGPRAINNQVFYVRLGQRVIHLLSTNTTQGDLYEVDMRLRPSGNSGMLVSSLSAFKRYQFDDAWTWEHQALVRARHVAGDSRVAEAFELIRNEVLSQKRDTDELMLEVREMRFKMKTAAEEKFKSTQKAADDIKLGNGGLVDIEFITQFGVLQGAQAYPDLLIWSDNIRLLETMQRLNLFSGVDMQALIDAYRTLRSALHRKNLADDDYEVTLSDFPEQRAVVQAAWCDIFGVCT